MIITRHAPFFFKLQFGDLVLAINPPSKDSGIKSARFGADIVVQSVLNSEFSGGSELTHGTKEPFVIQGPGEYEIKEIFIRGLPGKSNYQGKESINTIYSIDMEGMKICVLGLQSEKTLTAEARAGIGEVDILIIALGEELLSPSDAYKLAVSLEPKIIIPAYVQQADLKAFLKEGTSSSQEEEKITIKRKDIEGKEGDIIPLQIM